MTRLTFSNRSDGTKMEQLQMASQQAALHHRLLRARELCLLGDYTTGVPEFFSVLHDLKRQCTNSLPETQQILRELQNEYAVLLQYQKTLQDLRTSTVNIQDRRRRRREKANAWESGSRSSLGGSSVSSEDTTEPMEVDQQWFGSLRAESRSTNRITAATQSLTLEKRLPAWAKKQEAVSRPQASSQRTVTTRRTAPSRSTRSVPVKEKENVSKNVVARYGSSYKSTAEMALTQRRPTRAVPGASKKVDAQDSPNRPRSSDCDMIAGRKKYSELAKESGWADQELIDSIEREIVDEGEQIKFENIAGLHHTKQLLQEAVMLPQIAPHLFKDGLLKPCSGILMFGPPGTGKTLLAKAVANECGLTFFNVSASTLSSKYRGDSEKLVRILFEMARYYAPSIIFMDEIDAIASARGGANEHEASRRVKTELLVQINGVSTTEQDQGHVMLLAATNLPWELDEAMRRRLTKRVYIPLPEAEARRALFELNLGKVQLAPDADLNQLVAKTNGYSGDDITNVCETAKRMPVKRLYTPSVLSELSRRMADSNGSSCAEELERQQLVVTKSDFEEALQNVSKSVGQDQLKRFQEWEREFGSK